MESHFAVLFFFPAASMKSSAERNQEMSEENKVEFLPSAQVRPSMSVDRAEIPDGRVHFAQLQKQKNVDNRMEKS